MPSHICGFATSNSTRSCFNLACATCFAVPFLFCFAFCGGLQMNCRNPKDDKCLLLLSSRQSRRGKSFESSSPRFSAPEIKFVAQFSENRKPRALPASCKSAVTGEKTKSEKLYDRFMGDMRANKFLDFQLKSLGETHLRPSLCFLFAYLSGFVVVYVRAAL